MPSDAKYRKTGHDYKRHAANETALKTFAGKIGAHGSGLLVCRSTLPDQLLNRGLLIRRATCRFLRQTSRQNPAADQTSEFIGREGQILVADARTARTKKSFKPTPQPLHSKYLRVRSSTDCSRRCSQRSTASHTLLYQELLDRREHRSCWETPTCECHLIPSSALTFRLVFQPSGTAGISPAV
jgi:hypothetical protein